MEDNGNYFGTLFSNFDGETNKEKNDNFRLGFRACNDTKSLTKREVFIVSFILERMQFAKFGDTNKLEEIRLHILSNL